MLLLWFNHTARDGTGRGTGTRIGTYCASPIPCIGPGPIPVQCDYTIKVTLYFWPLKMGYVNPHGAVHT